MVPRARRNADALTMARQRSWRGSSRCFAMTFRVTARRATLIFEPRCASSFVSSTPTPSAATTTITTYWHSSNVTRMGSSSTVARGRRAVYFDNVVNFEIVPYDTTDVRGVGEELPFRDASFDAVVSIAVLEHVKDPFRCAREIARVLKPGGELICAVPFLPALSRLSSPLLQHDSPGPWQPVRCHAEDRTGSKSMTTCCRSGRWRGLRKAGRMGPRRCNARGVPRSAAARSPATAPSFLPRSFVKELSRKNLELACACVLFARK